MLIQDPTIIRTLRVQTHKCSRLEQTMLLLFHPVEDQDSVHFQIEEERLSDNQWSFQPKQKQSKLPMSSGPISRDIHV